MTTEQEVAVVGLVEIFKDQHLAADLAGKLTCAEANAFAGFLSAFFEPAYAGDFLKCHAEDDEEGDQHYESV